MTGFPEFDPFVCGREREFENIAIADYIDHIRAFGRFLQIFAGRAVA